MFSNILIANSRFIARRVIRIARQMALATVADVESMRACAKKPAE